MVSIISLDQHFKKLATPIIATIFFKFLLISAMFSTIFISNAFSFNFTSNLSSKLPQRQENKVKNFTELPIDSENIRFTRDHYISRTIVVNCSSPKLQSWYDFISERLCRPLVTPLYSLQPYLEATTSDNGSYNYTGFKSKLPTDPFLEEEEEEKFETNKEKDFSFSLPSSCEGYPPVCQPKFNKTYCCRSLAAADCHVVIGALLCSVEHYEELITVERLEYEGGQVVPFFLDKQTVLVKGQADREQEYQCSAYYSLDHCTHPLSLVVMLGLVGLISFSITVCCLAFCLKCCRRQRGKRKKAENSKNNVILENVRKSSCYSSKGVIARYEDNDF